MLRFAKNMLDRKLEVSLLEEFGDVDVDTISYNFNTDVDNSTEYSKFKDEIIKTLRICAENNEDVELELGDGATVTISPEDALVILSDDIDRFIDSLDSIESFLQFNGIELDIDSFQDFDDLTEARVNTRKVGRKKILNVVRGGKVKLRVQRSAVKGFRLQRDGSMKRMSAQEVRKRKIGARMASRKRRSKMAQITRRRKRSMRIRNSRLG